MTELCKCGHEKKYHINGKDECGILYCDADDNRDYCYCEKYEPKFYTVETGVFEF